jgi:hypothetical protein
MYGIGPPGVPRKITLLDTPYLASEWDLPTEVVLIHGESHYWIALDYRKAGPAGEPSVTWIDNEMDFELSLAPTFRAFVERLTSSPE